MKNLFLAVMILGCSFAAVSNVHAMTRTDWQQRTNYASTNNSYQQNDWQQNHWRHDVVPNHAHAVVNGYGWSCDFGYKQIDNECVVIFVPMNATLQSDNQWTCNAGYVKNGFYCNTVNDRRYQNDWQNRSGDPSYVRMTQTNTAWHQTHSWSR